LTMAISLKVWNMRQTADAKAVKAMNAESLRVRFSLAVGPWRKSMSVNGIMESVMRSTDTLRCVMCDGGQVWRQVLMQ